MSDKMSAEFGGAFLHKQDPQFHRTPDVEHTTAYLRSHGEDIPHEPAAKIAAYIGFLSNPAYVDDGIFTGSRYSTTRQVYNQVIEEEDIPPSYIEDISGLLADRSWDDWDDEPAERAILSIQLAQESTLQPWADWLGDDNEYPDWYKYYVWKGVTKLGVFNDCSQKFSKRSRSTAAPYPEPDEGAVTKVFEMLPDEPIARGFGKLYAQAAKHPEWQRATSKIEAHVDVKPSDYSNHIEAEIVDEFKRPISSAILILGNPDKESAYLMNVHTIAGKNYRGRGLCRQVIHGLESYALDQGLQNVKLHTMMTGFYEKLGYTLVGDPMGNDTDDSARKRIYEYTKALSPETLANSPQQTQTPQLAEQV